MCSILPQPEVRDHPVDIGQRAEAIILAELVKRGYVVLTPFGVNHRYDLVIDCQGRFIRAQCKTGRLRNGTILFATQSVRTNTRGAYLRPYHDEADLFLVYCPDTEKVYAVPVADVGSAGHLRVEPARNGQRKGIRLARDYELRDRD